MNVTRENPARIEAIDVTDLFGFLSYHLCPKTKEDLIILYGDNGSGKTTILNLVLHALAAEDARGHRSSIARIPFKDVSITLADGHRVLMERPTAAPGGFRMAVLHRKREIASHEVMVESDGFVRGQNEETYRPLLQALKDLDLGLFLLPDNRKIESNLYEDEGSPTRFLLRSHDVVFREKETPEENIDTFVNQALRRFTNWARRQALAGSSQGETDTGKIYVDIVKRISGRRTRRKGRGQMSFAELIEKAESLRVRSEGFGRFGLTSPFELREVLPELTKTQPSKKGIITKVLSPYVSSFEARLDALDQLREGLETFADIFGRFYKYKSLSFNLREGVQIIPEYGGGRLTPEVLSSGEKQLLLVFCNVLLATSRPSVFIIDEPELSLNIKWQRELISSLISCVKGFSVQFLLATHSLEMIALHKDNAIKLLAKR